MTNNDNHSTTAGDKTTTTTIGQLQQPSKYETHSHTFSKSMASCESVGKTLLKPCSFHFGNVDLKFDKLVTPGHVVSLGVPKVLKRQKYS